MRRAFLSKTARTQGQTTKAFKDPFKLVSVADIANMADTFTRNEILTSNEFRQIIGFKPADDPKADQLINSNMPQPSDGQMMPEQMVEEAPAEEVPVEETTEPVPTGELGNTPITQLMERFNS
jgi:hypothetical protein